MTASDTARAEAEEWIHLVATLEIVSGADLDPVPAEVSVTGFDPRRDLARRAERWSYVMPGVDLGELARFAAGLAMAESHAWEGDDAIVATRAFEDRRFLFSDRIVHWAVPWADVAGRCHPEIRDQLHAIRDRLLDLGDRLRPAPLLTGDEGLYPPGEDAFGPIETNAALADLLCSLHSGTVIFRATACSLTGGDHGRAFEPEELDDPTLRSDLRTMFESAAGRWRALAGMCAGTARLWRDLAVRADRTAERLSS